MKSITKEGKCEQEIKYPCLRQMPNGVGKAGKVVLFESGDNGTVVAVEDESSFKVGQILKGIVSADKYEPFTGSVCLEND